MVFRSSISEVYMRIYDNCIITDSIHIGNTEFVLGVSMTQPGQFFTWKCRDKTNYDDAQQFTILADAQKSVVQRAQEEITRLEQLSLEQAPKRMAEIVL